MPPSRSQKVTKPKPFQFNPFEQFKEEFVKKTVTGVGKQMLDMVNPLGPSANEQSDSQQSEIIKQQETDKKKNHTPLDLNGLGSTYKKKDENMAEALAQRYFHRVTDDVKKVYEESKQQKSQKEQEEEQAEIKKKRDLEEQKMAPAGEAEGKQKGRLGQPRKKAHVDTNFEAKYAKGR